MIKGLNYDEQDFYEHLIEVVAEVDNLADCAEYHSCFEGVGEALSHALNYLDIAEAAILKKADEVAARES